MIYDDEAAGGPPSSQWGPWIPGQYPASAAPPPGWAPFHPHTRFGGLWLPPSADEPQPDHGTPRWWLYRLLRKLDWQWAGMCLYEDYFNGHHRLAYTTTKFREAFGSLFNGFADNWCPIVVQSSVERMTVEGFRFGGQGQGADDDAWAIWQANNLDAESRKLHTEAVKLGKAAIIVDEGEDERYPRITVEHPREVYVECDPADRRRRVAAVKRWVDDEGHWMATVYLPDRVFKFRSAQPADNVADLRWVERPGVGFEEVNPLGVVPVIPVENDPSMLAGGQSDLKVGIPIQDAINKECNDMLVASEYAAYRQRVMTGVEQAQDAEGNPIRIELGVGRLFTVEAPDAKVYDLAASDLANYINAVEMYVQHMAAQTRTPPHYLLSKMANLSGDALKAAETGLVSKVRAKLTDFSEPWEEAMRLAFRLRGGDRDLERADATDAETLWRDPESRSFAQTVDGVVKLKEIGVPQEVLWERAGFSPQERARMKAMQTADELLAFADTPPQAEPTPAPDARV